ncbi:Protein UmuC [Pantoea dispersa]|nr:Protein UmuC [Pantoea dispersa]MCW0328143.1 Protein UmuC [Pantoea dispersa]MCW0434658.1 Protein UmuC [Pantoea dispersa]
MKKTDTRDVIGVAMRSLDRIWLNGQRYMEAGMMLNDFTPNGASQLNLFDEDTPRASSVQLMKVLDGFDQSGLGDLPPVLDTTLS